MTDYLAEAHRAVEAARDEFSVNTIVNWGIIEKHVAAALEAAEKRGLERACDAAYEVAAENELDCSWDRFRDLVRKKVGLPPKPEEEWVG